MKRPSITVVRRVCQSLCFILLVYSGFVLRSWVAARVGSASEPADNGSLRENVLFTDGAPALLDVYPPGAACFFVKGARFVKGCNTYLVSEALARRPSAAAVLPALFGFIFLSFLLGRWWCGWVCPLASLGDALTAVRRALNIAVRRWSIRTQAVLKTLAYGVLAATVGISFVIGLSRFRWLQKYLYLPFCEICPARLACPVLVGAAPSFAGGFSTLPHCMFTILMYGTLAFFLVAFFAARRMWCRFCPIGLPTAWFNRGSLLVLTKENARCNRCGACAEACPMGCGHVMEKKGNGLLNHPDCIFCLRCLELCPKEKCMSLRFLGLKLVGSRLRPVK